jgi:hypothetical protein
MNRPDILVAEKRSPSWKAEGVRVLSRDPKCNSEGASATSLAAIGGRG